MLILRSSWLNKLAAGSRIFDEGYDGVDCEGEIVVHV
jgi:hypothetical protein